MSKDCFAGRLHPLLCSFPDRPHCSAVRADHCGCLELVPPRKSRLRASGEDGCGLVALGMRHPARSSDHTECDDPRGRFETVGDGSHYEFHIEAAATWQHGIKDDIECCSHHFVGNVDLGHLSEAEPTISRTLRASYHGRQEMMN